MTANVPPHTTVTAPAHVVLLLFPAQGHVSPCLDIARYLAANGILVTLVQPLHGLLPEGAQTIHNDANGHGPLFRVETIPSGVDRSDPNPRKMMRAAIRAMGSSFTQLLQKLSQEENPPVCFLIDSFFEWGGAVAEEFGLPQVVIWAGSASVFTLGLHYSDLIKRGFVPATGEGALDKIIDFIPGLPPLRVSDMPSSFMAKEGIEGDGSLFVTSLFENVKLAERVLINSMYELEPSVLDALHRDQSLQVDAVGPLHMINTTSTPSADSSQESSSCLHWLDQQEQFSVLYIAFGSLAVLEEQALAELAHAVEASGERFLWVIRRDNYKNKASVEEILPEGFMECIRGRGMVISWAPQLAVLGHRSVGAFLTHCGWNSVLESLSNGVPMLGFPMKNEQHTNLKYIVHDWKVGLPLLPQQKIERNSMQLSVTAIMKDQELRTNARKWKETAVRAIHGSSKENLQKLVCDLKQGKVRHCQQ